MRGDVYRLRASRSAQDHEQQGVRYGVVLQSDDLPLSTLLVAPTSTSARPTGFRPVVEIDGARTLVLVEQTAAVDAETRLAEFAGRLNTHEMAAIDRALLSVFGLE